MELECALCYVHRALPCYFGNPHQALAWQGPWVPDLSSVGPCLGDAPVVVLSILYVLSLFDILKRSTVIGPIIDSRLISYSSDPPSSDESFKLPETKRLIIIANIDHPSSSSDVALVSKWRLSSINLKSKLPMGLSY